jgi:hypothetical protein
MMNNYDPMAQPMDMMIPEPPDPEEERRRLEETRKKLVALVNQQELDMQPLTERMEADFSRYVLTPHVNRDNVTGEALPNYATFTSSAPRSFADKVIAWASLAELLVRAPHMEVGGHEDTVDNLKERFAIGCLRSANERLAEMRQPVLQSAQAFFTIVRGGYTGGRCLLVKRPDGSTYVDITTWDPMHIHWGTGPDGLEWACYKIKKTAAQIKREYGVDISGGVGEDSETELGSSDAEREGIEVYDFYDGAVNWVFTDGEDLKPPTPHGSPRVPVYLALVGPVPLLQSQNASNLIKHVGESIFAGVRELYGKLDDVMSIFLEICERARRQTVVAESPDGSKTLEEDPFTTPTTLSTRTGDKIYTLQLQQMAQETMAYVQLILGEIQRATLPFSSYGETPFQLSGYAITQLRQATETVLYNRLMALESMYKQIANLLYDQFMTGRFEGIRLSGVDAGRKYFNQTIMPQELQDSCDYTVRLVSQLPQDDMSKWAQAQIALDTHLLSRMDIHDNILQSQDSQQLLDKVKLEMAEQTLPEAVLYDMMMAAANRGEMQIAQLYLMEYQRMMAVKLGVMPPAPADGSGKPQDGGQQQGGGGQRPEVQPQAARGTAPSQATSNDGPGRQAPGTPRPGAQGQ